MIPFLVSLLLLFIVASIPALSPPSEPSPFSLGNLATLVPQLPERLQELYGEEKESFVSEVSENWDGEDFFMGGEEGAEMVSELQEETPSEEGEIRNLASLPKGLQELIREALRRLPERDRLAQRKGGQEPGPSGELIRSKEKGESKVSVRGPGLSPGQKQMTSLAPQKRGKGSEGEGALAKGSGIQRLRRARLNKKPARGKFQPEGPVAAGKGGSAGEGGSGAGRGTDPRLFGNKTTPESGEGTFLLALEVSRTRGKGVEMEKSEAEMVEKAGSSMSQQQSLDDAIRKAQVPPEYEGIVKRLFSRRTRREQ